MPWQARRQLRDDQAHRAPDLCWSFLGRALSPVSIAQSRRNADQTGMQQAQ